MSMSIVSRYWVLVLGVVLVAVGLISILSEAPVASFGWTAYAPLTSTTFTPAYAPLIQWALLLIGLVLTAGWIGHRIGLRRAPGSIKSRD